jgi:hypothetical protein
MHFTPIFTSFINHFIRLYSKFKLLLTVNFAFYDIYEIFLHNIRNYSFLQGAHLDNLPMDKLHIIQFL